MKLQPWGLGAEENDLQLVYHHYKYNFTDFLPGLPLKQVVSVKAVKVATTRDKQHKSSVQ